MKKLSITLAIIFLAGCSGMMGGGTTSGSSSMPAGTNTEGGYYSGSQFNESNQNPLMDLRSRDHAFDPYFGG